MTLQIGRILGLPEPMAWKQTGDQVQISGRYAAGSANAARVARAQLLGYNANPSEPIIPIVSSADDQLSGFHLITAVDVPTTPALLLSSGTIEYVLQATRLPGGFGAAYVESALTGALANGPVSVTGLPYHAYPNASYEYRNIASDLSVPTMGRATADGTTWVWIQQMQLGGVATYKGTARYTVPPANCYDSAVAILNSAPVSHTVVGNQESPAATAWTLNNGLVQVFLNAGGYFQFSFGDDSRTYRSSAAVFLSGAGGGLFYSVSGLNAATKILRNAPEECIIRVPVVPVNAIAWTPMYIDVALRRGSRVVRFLVVGKSDTWTVGFQGGAATTALTGGQVKTANDGFGNRSLICSTLTRTDDLVNGKFTITGARTSLDFGVGFENLGTGSSSLDTAQNIIYEYNAVQAETARVVTR